MTQIIRYLLTISLTLAGAWFVGLLMFVAYVQVQAMPDMGPSGTPADGIVVLTGGEGRVAVGIKLLADKQGRRLLISGVHPETNKQNILPAQAVPDKANTALLECCVDLGYAADSTVGNAEEAAKWAGERRMKSLLIVTAAYHLPRARLEFARVLPDAALLFYPLTRDNVKLGAALEEPWTIPGTVQLIATEYSKYLFAVGRAFSRYLPL